MIDKMVEEMKSKPFTMLMMAGMYAGMTFLWRSSASYAGVAELESLKSDVAGIREELTKTSLEQQLRSVRSELFTLQRTVEELNSGRKPVPQAYLARIDTLINDQDSLARRLTAIYSAEAAKSRGR